MKIRFSYVLIVSSELPLLLVLTHSHNTPSNLWATSKLMIKYLRISVMYLHMYISVVQGPLQKFKDGIKCNDCITDSGQSIWDKWPAPIS